MVHSENARLLISRAFHLDCRPLPRKPNAAVVALAAYREDRVWGEPHVRLGSRGSNGVCLSQDRLTSWVETSVRPAGSNRTTHAVGRARPSALRL